ncbi:hypothetical protein [Rhodococcus sp. ACT016]
MAALADVRWLISGMPLVTSNRTSGGTAEYANYLTKLPTSMTKMPTI